MKDVELMTIQLRLEGIRQAITRARFTLLVAIIASIAIIIPVWNAYLSPDSEFVTQLHWSHDEQFTAEKLKELQRNEADSEIRKLEATNPTEVTDHAQKELVSEWVKNQIISVGLLGIRVSVADLSVLGSLSLFIISVWLFFAIRRENRAIGTLLRDAYLSKDWNWDERYMIYQGIIHHLVFLDFGRGDQPIDDFEKEESDEIYHMPLLRTLVKSLFFLPPFAITLVIIMDVLTLCCLDAPFRPSHTPLWEILGRSDFIWAAGTDGFAFLLFIFTSIICWKSLKFTTATSTLLYNYRARLKESKAAAHQQ